MIKLSEISKSLLKENSTFNKDQIKQFEKIGEKLINNDKLIDLVSSYMIKNPNAISTLEKKVGKILSTNENSLDFSIDYNAINKLSLDISKDIDVDIKESIQTTFKLASKVLNLLGLNSFSNIVMAVVKNFLTDGIIDNLPIEQVGIVSQIELIITICMVILQIMRNLKNAKAV